MAGIAMLSFDNYVIDVLMRDLARHDRKPASFLVYLWLSSEQQRRRARVPLSYQELAENVGISKSSAQSAVQWLARRRLITAAKAHAAAAPVYTVLTPWRRKAR
jgi:hypothetical protein